MLSRPSLIPLTALAAAATATARPHEQRDDSYGIEWAACPPEVEEIATIPVKCANISVPLDYTDADNGKTHTLELIKAPAQNTTAEGSIIFNFGGPGAEGLVNMATNGVVYAA